MSCCTTAHLNSLALPVFHYLAQCNQKFGLSFFFIAIVLRILFFLHAHHNTATGQCNRLHPARTALSCPHWASDTLNRSLQDKNLYIGFTVR
jgi:hypothetical protein